MKSNTSKLLSLLRLTRGGGSGVDDGDDIVNRRTIRVVEKRVTPKKSLEDSMLQSLRIECHLSELFQTAPPASLQKLMKLDVYVPREDVETAFPLIDRFGNDSIVLNDVVSCGVEENVANDMIHVACKGVVSRRNVVTFDRLLRVCDFRLHRPVSEMRVCLLWAKLVEEKARVPVSRDVSIVAEECLRREVAFRLTGKNIRRSSPRKSRPPRRRDDDGINVVYYVEEGIERKKDAVKREENVDIVEEGQPRIAYISPRRKRAPVVRRADRLNSVLQSGGDGSSKFTFDAKREFEVTDVGNDKRKDYVRNQMKGDVVSEGRKILMSRTEHEEKKKPQFLTAFHVTDMQQEKVSASLEHTLEKEKYSDPSGFSRDEMKDEGNFVTYFCLPKNDELRRKAIMDAKDMNKTVPVDTKSPLSKPFVTVFGPKDKLHSIGDGTVLAALPPEPDLETTLERVRLKKALGQQEMDNFKVFSRTLRPSDKYDTLGIKMDMKSVML